MQWHEDVQMELKELRSFCATARLQSITKAAKYLDRGRRAVTSACPGTLVHQVERWIDEDPGYCVADERKSTQIATTINECVLKWLSQSPSFPSALIRGFGEPN